MHEDSEEARQWHEGESQDAVEPSAESSARYSALDDRHVWDSRDEDDS